MRFLSFLTFDGPEKEKNSDKYNCNTLAVDPQRTVPWNVDANAYRERIRLERMQRFQKAHLSK